MRRCADFPNFFFQLKPQTKIAHFELTTNSLDANPFEKSTAAETSKFGLFNNFQKLFQEVLTLRTSIFEIYSMSSSNFI